MPTRTSNSEDSGSTSVELVALLLDAITVRFGAEPVLHALTLRVDDGEAVALLGPSGSGKTTVLRAVAGFESPESGDILFDGRRMNDVEPAGRNLAMVFQENVLIPHVDVRGNVGFPLQVRRTPKEEIARRVEAETRATGIANLLARSPSQLSAGQQQVVQLARAMVRRPDVFLIDEPFARLDPLGTDRLRAELKLVQSGYGVTALYATHSYSDALALADRVAVLDRGRVRQVGTPREIYEKPSSIFVASMVGEPPIGLIDVETSAGALSVGDLCVPVPARLPREAVLGVRPEGWLVGSQGLEARVSRSYSISGHYYAVLDSDAGEVTLRTSDRPHEEGSRIRILPGPYHVFDRATGEAVYHSEA